MKVQLKNVIFKELVQIQNNGGVPHHLPIPRHHMKEPLDFVRGAQENWESKLRRGINLLCTEIGVPLSKEVRTCHCLPEGVIGCFSGLFEMGVAS